MVYPKCAWRITPTKFQQQASPDRVHRGNELKPGGLSIFTAACTVFNTSGASLYIPWAFAQGGTLLTSIVLGAVLLQSYVTASFLLEATARAQALDLLKTDGSLPQRYTPLKIRERKYELSLLTKIFLGKAGNIFFSLTTLTSMYGFLWAFCTIFANAFADKFPLGDAQQGGYKIYIGCIWLLSYQWRALPSPSSSGSRWHS
jgi:amino acid permease